jgi:hypothetical protein
MAYTDREDVNHLGQLFMVGASQTPFLNMIGGINGAKTCKSFTFPVAQPYNLASASQPAITEADSVTGQTPTTVVRGQDFNTVQIFQAAYAVSYAKQSAYGEVGVVSGLSVLGDQPVVDEMAFQREAALEQVALDMEYSFLQGTYQLGSSVSTAAKTRGLKNAITTSTVAGSSGLLTKAMIDETLREMVAAGAKFKNMVILANAYQKQQITNIFGYVPAERNIGGLNIKQVETDFAMFGVVWCPHMPTDEIYLVDLSVCSPMILPVKGQAIIVEDKAYIGAAEGGQVYIQAGLDYGAEEYHGSITGLKNS